MHICFIASECSPFAKTGGLGDAVQGLTTALAARGHAVTALLPAYAAPAAAGGSDTTPAVPLSQLVRGKAVHGGLRHRRLESGVDLVRVVQPSYYGRPELYGENGRAYPDNAERFAFLAHAALQLPQALNLPVDVFHCHDWHAGLVPFYLRTAAAASTPRPATVLTVHNLAYQGNFAAKVLDDLHLDPAAYTWQGIELYGKLSYLKAGLVTADRLTTVSPQYAEEIQTPVYGAGLDGVLRDRRHVLDGILNGTDYDYWDPAHDPHLPAPFDAEHLAGKRTCRDALIRTCGWSPAPTGPVFGMVARLVHQKGADLIPAILPAVRDLDGRVVVLGNGDPKIEASLRKAADARSELLHVVNGFDEALAHRIIAGSDAMLMPSRFEPCGLTQIYALRYGTVPVVRATGGLVDTVAPSAGADVGTGFVFEADAADAFARAIREAGRVFADTDAWAGIVARGMAQRFTWDDAAAAYERVYAKALEARDHPAPLPWEHDAVA